MQKVSVIKLFFCWWCCWHLLCVFQAYILQLPGITFDLMLLIVIGIYVWFRSCFFSRLGCVFFCCFLFALDAANAVVCVSDVCFTKLYTSLPGAASSVYLCFRWCISWLPFQLPVVPDTACLLQVVYFTKHCFCSSFCPSSCYSCASGGAFHRVQLTLLLCIRWCTLQSTMNSVPVSQLVCFTEHN